ncbi:MAG: hypothetical protein IPK28_02615 [Devosia sp.]|nr:hypothetical protein [Devosia sp.]
MVDATGADDDHHDHAHDHGYAHRGDYGYGHHHDHDHDHGFGPVELFRHRADGPVRAGCRAAVARPLLA